MKKPDIEFKNHYNQFFLKHKYIGLTGTILTKKNNLKFLQKLSWEPIETDNKKKLYSKLSI